MAGTRQEIALTPGDQIFKIALAGTPYLFRIMWNNAGGGYYAFDIGDDAENIILAGMPLLPGSDLLGQHRHLGIGGQLVVTTDRGAGDAVTYDGLGTTSHLFFIPDA